MKFSLNFGNVWSAFVAVWKRFPLAVLTAFIATACGLFLVHNQETITVIKVLIVCTLAFPVFIATTLVAETKPLSHKQHSGVRIGALLFMVFYYFLLPNYTEGVNFEPFFRHILWFGGFISLVTFVPFLHWSAKDKSGLKELWAWLRSAKAKVSLSHPFWEFNRRLFGGLFTTIFYAICLFGGLAIAFASADYLFDLNIDGERYGELWVMVVGVFSTLSFLHRVPKKSNKLSAPKNFPKELKIFAQYILLPLLVIYFLILYAYTAKIVFTWEWPKGTVSWMIIWFSFVGVLVYFFLYPLRELKAWVEKFGTIFWTLLIPQVAVLFYAVGLRINQYGVTENRYLVVLFGIWLLGLALYYLFSKAKKLSVITVSLFAILFLSSFGPWGAFDVAEHCQLKRLDVLLTETGLKENLPNLQVGLEDRQEIFAITDYLIDYHGAESLQNVFPSAVAQYDKKKQSRYDLQLKIAEELGVEYAAQHHYRDDDTYFNVWQDYNEKPVIPIAGYDFMMTLNQYDIVKERTVTLDDNDYQIVYDKTSAVLSLKTKTQEVETVVEEVRLQPFFDGLLEFSKGNNGYKKEDLTFRHDGQVFNVMMVLQNVSGTKNGVDTVEVNHWNGAIFFGKK